MNQVACRSRACRQAGCHGCQPTTRSLQDHALHSVPGHCTALAYISLVAVNCKSGPSPPRSECTSLLQQINLVKECLVDLYISANNASDRLGSTLSFRGLRCTSTISSTSSTIPCEAAQNQVSFDPGRRLEHAKLREDARRREALGSKFNQKHTSVGLLLDSFCGRTDSRECVHRPHRPAIHCSLSP